MNLEMHPDFLTMYKGTIINNVVKVHCIVDIEINDTSAPDVIQLTYFTGLDNKDYHLAWTLPHGKATSIVMTPMEGEGEFLGRFKETSNENGIWKGTGILELCFDLNSIPLAKKTCRKMGNEKFLAKCTVSLAKVNK